MTSKLTSNERLAKILSETQATIMEHNSRCVRGSVEVDARLFEEMLIELQERRKAAMDSEPVAWMHNNNDIGMPAITVSPKIGQYWMTEFKDVHPLYRHAQPAPVVPVVPDEVEHVAAVLELIGSFEAADIDSDTVDLRLEIDDVDTGSDASITEYAARGAAIIRMLAGNSPAIPGAEQRIADVVELLKQAAPAMLADNHGPDGPLVGRLKSPAIPDGSTDMLRRWLSFGRGMQSAGSQLPRNLIAETEAMLAAAPQPQNEPQNIPEIIPGWIPVSDRMPDETQPVIVVSDGGVVQRTVYQFCEGVWSDWYDMYDDVNVEAFTHWMALPAAPQELK